MLTQHDIEDAISKTNTMGKAAAYLKVSDRTFKKYAQKYGLYKPAGAKNIKYKLTDILSGKHPQYPTSKLSKRLVKEGYKDYKCEKCGIQDWCEEKISLELNHIDGDRYNHSIENLELLCPNCHSQTPTYRSKKLKFKRLGN